MQKQIVVDIGLEGNVKIDAVGFSGVACTQATAALEKALGVVKARTEKSEMRAPRQTVTAAHS